MYRNPTPARPGGWPLTVVGSKVVAKPVGWKQRLHFEGLPLAKRPAEPYTHSWERTRNAVRWETLEP
jgi:hypothetical protein